MKIYPNNDAAVAAVRNGEVVAYLTDFATLQYYASVRILLPDVS